MQPLFLALRPPHNNSEMRRILLDHSGTARDKTLRIKGDYFFKVINDTRRTIASVEPEKRPDSRQAQPPVLDGRAKVAAAHDAIADVHQPQNFSDLRKQLEEKVNHYLVAVLKTSDIRALESEPEGLENASNVTEWAFQHVCENFLVLNLFG